MDVVHARCAGLDISKKDAKVCIRVAGVGRRKAVETVTTWSSMTGSILALRDHLAAEEVTCVVMEATGDYWKPFYYLLEDLEGVEVLLVPHIERAGCSPRRSSCEAPPSTSGRGVQRLTLGIPDAVGTAPRSQRRSAGAVFRSLRWPHHRQTGR